MPYHFGSDCFNSRLLTVRLCGDEKSMTWPLQAKFENSACSVDKAGNLEYGKVEEQHDKALNKNLIVLFKQVRSKVNRVIFDQHGLRATSMVD